MDEKISYWVELSEYDLATADAMLKTERYLYVGFMCHQALEKILKAHYQFAKKSMPPKTHNLLFLLEEAALASEMSEKQLQFLDRINPLNLESRYPEDKEKIAKFINREQAREILHKTKDIYRWIRKALTARQRNT